MPPPARHHTVGDAGMRVCTGFGPCAIEQDGTGSTPQTSAVREAQHPLQVIGLILHGALRSHAAKTP